jgi:hypothetical protein
VEVGRVCGTYGEKRNRHRVLLAKPEGKKPLGRLSLKWERK